MTDETAPSQNKMTETYIADWSDLRDDLLGSQRGYYRKPAFYGENRTAVTQAETPPLPQKIYSDSLGSTYR